MKSNTSYAQGNPTICNICGGEVRLIHTGKQYSSSGYIYKCIECGASVGTHPNNPTQALGTLADTETKAKRREVHVWFDKLWHKHSEREKMYKKLAKELGISIDECHFGIMTMEQLDKALAICKKWWLEKYDI